MAEREDAPTQAQIGKGRTWRASSKIESIEPDPAHADRMMVTTTDGAHSMPKAFADKSKVGDVLSAYSDGKNSTVVNETQHVMSHRDTGADGQRHYKIEAYTPAPHAPGHKAATPPTKAELGGDDKQWMGSSKITKIVPDPAHRDRLNVSFGNGQTESMPKEFAGQARVGDTVSGYYDGRHNTIVNESRHVLMRNEDGHKHTVSEYGRHNAIQVETGKGNLGHDKGPGMAVGGTVAGVTRHNGQTELDYVTRGEHHFVRVPDGTQPGSKPWNKPLSDAMEQLKPGETFNLAIHRSAAGTETAQLTAAGHTTCVHGNGTAERGAVPQQHHYVGAHR